MSEAAVKRYFVTGFQGSPPDGHVAAMITTYGALLSARRVIAHRSARREGRSGYGQEALETLERLEAEYERWALSSPPDAPEFWLSAYRTMLRSCELLIRALTEELETASPPERTRILGVDLPTLRGEALNYRRRLVRWHRRDLGETG